MVIVVGPTRIALRGVAALAFVAASTTIAVAADTVEQQRAAMVRTIESYWSLVAPVVAQNTLDSRVRDVMATVPRHAFVPDAVKELAYRDRPLPIGHGQTISQPFIVALMTHLLAPKPDHAVLEVGTGSGYQAAVLARLVRRVYSIEIVSPLAAEAKERLARLGYGNVEIRAGDGYSGWPEAAPFDGIIVTAAADHVPRDLVRQLRPGGQMVIPLRDKSGDEHLTVLQVGADGTVKSARVLPVRFVPLTRGRK